MLYSLYDAVKSAKDKMLLDEVKEIMSKSITADVPAEFQIKESIRQRNFIPQKIGTNKDISSHSKFNKNGAKYIWCG